MRGEVGLELAATPFARYVAIRVAGVFMISLSSVGIGLGILAALTGGGLVIGIVTVLGTAFSFYLSSVWACSRRARVFENGFTPVVLPLTERFRPRTPIISLPTVSEISNLSSGSVMNGLMFEMRDGKRYYVTDTQVGHVALYEFLNLNYRLYS